MVILPLTRAGIFEDDIIEGFAEIAQVGYKGMLLFLLQVLPFGIDDLLERIGHIGIVRGNQTRLKPGSEFLHFLGIETEIVLA